jgi:hypothetical protein
MECRICGDDGAEMRWDAGMALCASCSATTPSKVCREQFDREFWGEGPEAAEVPYSTRRDFYADYKASTAGTVAQYRAQTSGVPAGWDAID